MVIKKNKDGKYYFTDAGEINKISHIDDGTIEFFNGSNVFMWSYTGGNYARCYSVVSVHFADEQTEEQYGTELVYCCDPRVVMACLICFWLEQNSGFKITDEQVNAIINPVPTIEEAEKWLTKNGFVLYNTELKQYENVYLADYKALKYPPKIDIDLEALRRQE